MRAEDAIHRPTRNESAESAGRAKKPMSLAHWDVVYNRKREALGYVLRVERLISLPLVRREESSVLIGSGAELLIRAAADEFTPGIRSEEPRSAGHALLRFTLERMVGGVTAILIQGRHSAAKLRIR